MIRCGVAQRQGGWGVFSDLLRFQSPHLIGGALVNLPERVVALERYTTSGRQNTPAGSFETQGRQIGGVPPLETKGTAHG
jgi:hypothetical protein